MLKEVSSKELSEWKAYFNLKKKYEEEEEKKMQARQKAKKMGTF